MTISRRAILGFLGSIVTAPVLAKLIPVAAEPIPVPDPFPGADFVESIIPAHPHCRCSVTGDLYYNMSNASLFFKRDGSDKWESLGVATDFRIARPTEIVCGTQDPASSLGDRV